MRLTPIVLTLAIAGATMASAGYGQRADDQINPRSAALVEQARAATASGQYEQANDLLESALAVDPRNRAAYIALGRVAHDSVVTSLGAKRSAAPFGHGAQHRIGPLMLFDSYHCSRYNTNTGVLTTKMFHAVFAGLRDYLGVTS